MAREVAAAHKIDKDAAVELLAKSLSAKKPIPTAEAAEASRLGLKKGPGAIWGLF